MPRSLPSYLSALQVGSQRQGSEEDDGPSDGGEGEELAGGGGGEEVVETHDEILCPLRAVHLSVPSPGNSGCRAGGDECCGSADEVRLPLDTGSLHPGEGDRLVLLDRLSDGRLPDQVGRAGDAVEEDRGPSDQVVEPGLGGATAGVAVGGVGGGGELDVAH